MMAHFSNRAGMDRAYRARHVFAPYYRLFNELARGEVTAVGDTPMVEHEDELLEAAPALHGWVACWERIDARRPVGANLAAITRIAHKLSSGTPIPPADVATARRALDACLRAYKRLPLHLIREAARTEELSIKFEQLGLIPPAGDHHA